MQQAPSRQAPNQQPQSLAPQAQQLVPELHRFRVRSGQEGLAREWIAFLRSSPAEFLATLPGEQTFVETIFSDVQDGRLFLSWYSLQGAGALSVLDSEAELDRRHLAYHRRCIDPDWGPQVLQAEVLAVPGFLRERMTASSWP